MSQVLSGENVLSFSFMDTWHFIFTKMEYQKSIPTLNLQEAIDNIAISKLDGNKYLAQHSFGVKYQEWSLENEYRLVVNTNSKASGLFNLEKCVNPSFLKITGMIMGQNLGKFINNDIIDFIRSQQLVSAGKPFTANSIDTHVKDFIADLCFQENKDIYLAHCSTDAYQILKQDYKSGTNMR